MTELIINLATRNRHEIFPDTAQRTLAQIKRPGTRLIITIDADDQQSIDAAQHLLEHPQCELFIRTREDSLGGKYNRVLLPAGSDVIYLGMVDYNPILTPGFDEKILWASRVFPDGIGVVYGALANMSFPCLQAITQGFVDMQGGIWYPTCYPYWFVDHELQDIARMVGRIAYAPISADFVTRRPPQTLELRDVFFWSTFFDTRYLVRRELALSIIWNENFKSPLWLKQMLSEAIPLTEQLSVMINSNCRSTAPQIQEQRGNQVVDERYKRMFLAAVEQTKELVRELDGFTERVSENRPAFARLFGEAGVPGFTAGDADDRGRERQADIRKPDGPAIVPRRQRGDSRDRKAL